MKKLITSGLLKVLLFLLFIITLALNFYLQSTPTFLDHPFKLSATTEIIDVNYVNWACDCANFIETKYAQNDPNYEVREEDCIFIEPANAKLKLPERYFKKDHFEKKLRLTGQFYLKKGIPRFYEQKTPKKPAAAKVFRYTKFEVVD
ncbi:MAG: hypothetical protein SFV55_18515 [Haliscomenobacter sp.]|uniref:hypothetical protein n=1 Tax=Haliscomenobacter sp. TaxID=2717303 RepID=UPI0029A5437B|nr:hypothetical protein [Haliscomenobacter sp.]MDX2070427.1 hypothetical protein [Haliscomenobacter sp.]